jgi:hypothetical protein
MTDSKLTKKLSGIPPGRCVHTTEKEIEMSHANLSRRAIVAGAASVPALVALPAVAAAATEPDPAFAAAARLTRAWAEHGRICEAEPENDFVSPEYTAWKKAEAAAGDEDLAALQEMIETRLTTNAGAVAIVRTYLDTYGQSGSDMTEQSAALLGCTHRWLL